MKFIITLTVLFAILGCGVVLRQSELIPSLTDTREPTSRPTYTPYPTPRPTYTPYPTPTLARQSDHRPTNTASKPTPGIEFAEVGEKEWFLGPAGTAVEEGQDLFRRGQYRDAIDSFKEAKRHHKKPSAVLDNWIALSYDNLEEYDKAIQYHSYAIAIDDDAISRANRASSYMQNDQCTLAIDDAKEALEMEPQRQKGYHTDVEANAVLAMCYYLQDDYILALQHVDASITIARQNQYSTEDIGYISELRDSIREEASR